MNTNEKTILVTGATGRQGGAVVKHLLARGWKVRALTRNPAKPTAQSLKAKGVELALGDQEDRASLNAALTGVHGVFSVQNFWEKTVRYDGEIRQARNLAEAAQRAGISQFVQSSIAACDQTTNTLHFDSKWEIEKILAKMNIPRTILRVVFFMDNFVDPKTGALMPMTFAALSGGLRSTTRLHMIAVDDIGSFAAMAFEQPETYLGRMIDLAGDCLTVDEMKVVYTKVTGQKTPRFSVPSWVLYLMDKDNDINRQFAFNNNPGWQIDVAEVRTMYSDLKNFETWLRETVSKGG